MIEIRELSEVDTTLPLEVCDTREEAGRFQDWFVRSLQVKGLTPRLAVAVRPTRRGYRSGPYGIYLVVRR